MITRTKTKRYKGIDLKSGYFYRFKYRAWRYDPQPTIIFMYSFSGIHPNTGRQWRFFQAINFTYIPRSVRRRFLSEWKQTMERNPTSKNLEFTWQKVTSKYPWLKIAVRRYFYSPADYITNLEEIPFSELDKVIISTWSKDFSKKVVGALVGKFKQAIKARKILKDKRKKQKETIRRQQAEARARQQRR